MLATRLRGSSWARGTTASLALALALNVTDATAATSSAVQPGDFEQLIADADGHADAGRDAEALEAYADAFDAMPEELKTSEVGEFVALATAKAALADFDSREDPASLERAQDVLEQFIEVADAAGLSVEAAKDLLAEIVTRIPEDEPEPDDEFEQEVELEDPSDDPPPPRRGLALGLLGGGAAAAVAGLGLVIAGTRQVPWYEQKLEEGGWATDDPGYDDQIASAERIRNIDLGLGAALLVVGVGLGVGGGVLLARGRGGSESRASLTPSLRRHGGGLALRVDF